MRSLKALIVLLCALAAACGQKPEATEEASAPPSSAAEASSSATAASAPPTLAPMLREVSPGVVNIAVRGTVQTALNPLFQDPLFRRFFGIPDIPPEQQFQAVGSGVIYDAAKGYVITNSHVVERADSILVNLADRRQFKATLVGTDKETDVAVLKIEADNLAKLKLGDSSKLKVGDYVVAIGNPFGVGQTATFGIVSALGRSGLGIESYEDFIQTDASINPGNSGGALFDLNGEVVGMNTAIISQSGGNVGIGFAIPINMVKSVVEQLIAHGKVARGQLGVIVQDLTPSIAEAMGVGASGGAVISQVLRGSAAERGGLESGDIIVALNGKPLRDASELRNAVGLKPPGTTVELTVLRKGAERTIKITTEETAAVGGVSAPKGSPIDGVKLGPIPPEDPLFGKVQGAYVMEVAEGSPAAQAGLEPGHIIVGANQKPVTSPEELLAIMAASKSEVLLLNIRRGDTAIFLTIR